MTGTRAILRAGSLVADDLAIDEACHLIENAMFKR